MVGEVFKLYGSFTIRSSVFHPPSVYDMMMMMHISRESIEKQGFRKPYFPISEILENLYTCRGSPTGITKKIGGKRSSLRYLFATLKMTILYEFSTASCLFFSFFSSSFAALALALRKGVGVCGRPCQGYDRKTSKNIGNM